MKEWRLVNYGEPVNAAPEEYDGYHEFYATATIESEEQLREELQRLRRGEPTLLHLYGPPDGYLSIGLGEALSGLGWRAPSPGLVPHKQAFNPRPLTDQWLVCWDDGGGADFRPEHQLPTDEVIAAVGYYYRHGRLSDALQWVDL
jgi:hypothetical protein